MSGQGPISRRSFLETSAATAGATIVARHVLGGPKYIAPSDKINVGYVGSGTQGIRQLMPALKHAAWTTVRHRGARDRSQSHRSHSIAAA